jgi:hypothetical protein
LHVEAMLAIRNGGTDAPVSCAASRFFAAAADVSRYFKRNALSRGFVREALSAWRRVDSTPSLKY